jgi:rare lipoprotein A
VRSRPVAWLALVVAAVGACHRAGPAPSPAPVPGHGAHAATGADEGVASYYDSRLTGRRTASGERYDPEAFTAAHRTAPLGSCLLVTRLDDGRAVRVRVNDRGPFVHGRVVDLSRAAARELGFLRSGVARVRVEPCR